MKIQVLSRTAALALLSSGLFAASSTALTQTAALKPADRISGAIDNTARVELAGSTSPRAMHSTDLGAVPANTPLHGISLVFSRSAAQQADLASLVAAQQDPSSPLFHQWLTPAQFGARFGISDNDLSTTESWLQSQGFTIDAVSPSRDRILVSGAESAVESAFGTPLHYFKPTSGSLGASSAQDMVTHIAPAHNLTLPAALSSLVLAVGNLSDYRPRSYAIRKPTAAFTSSVSGSHYLTPKDVATIYDLNPAYNLGYQGQGQTIAVAGQSAVLLSDISNFQTDAGVAANTPNQILVPNSGNSQTYTGDWAESDLDLEYSSSIANKATIDFIYTGNSPYYGVFDSVIYAIENDVAPIITLSYGECEPDLGQSTYNYYDAFFQQAAAQGQTVINSAGDSGSTACYGDGSATSNQQQLAVSYPASSAYVTGLGGSEFPAADVAVGNNTYFTAEGSTDVIGSALSYIPEQAWNDDSASGGLSSGGGGVSIYTPKPTWQTGVTGIPAGSYRFVPDISLDASPNNAGYLYCSSDNGTSGTGVTNSCSVGFRNATGGNLTVAGGTSFAAPIFAGMLAVLNQAKGYNTGQGLINSTLYTLAANTATYAAAFHDITSGGNQCSAGSAVCGTGAAVTSYSTTAGYDEATGLGSIDLYKLIQAWPVSTNTHVGSSTAVSANSLTPSQGATDAITVQVSGTGVTPTGTVAITDNGTTVSGSPFNLTSGAYIYQYPTPSCGIHKIVFTYSGDGVYASSKATSLLNACTSSFTISAPTVTVKSGSSTTETVTFTSVNGYSGTVLLDGVAAPSTLTNACYTGPTSVNVTTTTPGTATFTVYTSASACPSNAIGLRANPTLATGAILRSAAVPAPRPGRPWKSGTIPATLAGLFLVGCFRRRSQFLRAGIALGMVLVLGLSGLGLTGCSNGNSGASSSTTTTTTTTTTTGNTTTGSYSLTIYANDSVDSAVASNSTFTLTVD